MCFFTHASQLKTETTYLGKLISSIDRAHNCWNGIWNDPLCLVILSVYGSVKCNETKWQKPQFQLQVWLQMKFELATYIFCYNAQNTLCAAHLPQTTLHTMFWLGEICTSYFGAPYLWYFWWNWVFSYDSAVWYHKHKKKSVVIRCMHAHMHTQTHAYIYNLCAHTYVWGHMLGY